MARGGRARRFFRIPDQRRAGRPPFARPAGSLYTGPSSAACHPAASTSAENGPMPSGESTAERAYALARERYELLGVDVEAALRRLAAIPISLHCWQGDDVGGFENAGQELGGGLAVTGNYPGKARTPQELRSDFEKAVSLIPGSHRFNVHACYAEMNGKKVDRDALTVDQFKNWIGWAKSIKVGLDFNQTYFAHPKSA